MGCVTLTCQGKICIKAQQSWTPYEVKIWICTIPSFHACVTVPLLWSHNKVMDNENSTKSMDCSDKILCLKTKLLNFLMLWAACSHTAPSWQPTPCWTTTQYTWQLITNLNSLMTQQSKGQSAKVQRAVCMLSTTTAIAGPGLGLIWCRPMLRACLFHRCAGECMEVGEFWGQRGHGNSCIMKRLGRVWLWKNINHHHTS